MALNEHSIDVAHVKDGRPRSRRAVLVDWVQPQGQHKDEAPWDKWLKIIAPSTGLRKQYRHEQDKHEEFVRCYRAKIASDELAKAFKHLQQLH